MAAPWLTFAAFSLLLAVIFRALLQCLYRWRHMPPGPWGLPLIGYLPWIQSETHLTFQQLREKYGNIFSMKMGGETVVILADYAAVKAALVDKAQAFNGRPFHHTFDSATERKSVSFSDGPSWKQQRRLTIKCLRNMGMGRQSMENLVCEAAATMADKLSHENGQLVALDKIIFKPIMSVVWKMVSSKNFVEGNADDEQFEHNIINVMEGMRANNPIIFMPWLRFMPPDGFGFWRYMQNRNHIWNYLQQEVKQHFANWKPGQTLDLMDEYINAIKEHQENPQSQAEEHLTSERLVGTVWDMFMAGADTTTSTLLWSFLYLATWPEVQRKVQQELDEVVGPHRMPCLDDFQQKRLPYTEATVMEVHRYASIIPLSLAHCPMETTELLGYVIPKRTPCLQNIYGVHHDPQLWDQPHLFNPSRFIDGNNVAKWPPYLMPFSLGPRQCVGESLAQQFIKIVFSHLLHNFTFTLPPQQPAPSLKSRNSLVVRPLPYSLLVETRAQ